MPPAAPDPTITTSGSNWALLCGLCLAMGSFICLARDREGATPRDIRSRPILAHFDAIRLRAIFRYGRYGQSLPYSLKAMIVALTWAETFFLLFSLARIRWFSMITSGMFTGLLFWSACALLVATKLRTHF